MRKVFKKLLAVASATVLVTTALLSNGVVAKAGEDTLPEKFDLRDYGYVTPVKFQNPWGSCWSFASIAAAEISILGELELTYTQFEEKYGIAMDLSEKHLSYFAATPLPEGTSQAGEGIVMLDPSKTLDKGGNLILSSSLFASGIGPYLEIMFPYCGKNEVIEYRYLNAEGKVIAVKDSPDEEVEGTTEVRPFCYSKNDDWTIDEAYRFGTAFVLEESNIMTSPANSDGSLNVDALNKMKKELLNKKGIAIQFFSSETNKDSLGNISQYYNRETAAHYVADLGTGVNHGVTIVGYDDNYSKDNFAITPPGDGAFIVKNSWGAADNEFPNKYAWGYENSGYFYLSYYDNSISMPETYDFAVEQINVDIPEYIVDRYDYMPGVYDYSKVGFEDKISFLNVYTAELDMLLNQVSLDVPIANAEVEIEVYSLGDSFESPIDGELVYEATKSFENAGYHRFIFDKSVYVEKDAAYSIVATIKDGDGKHYLSFRANISNEGQQMLEATTPDYKYDSYAVGVVNEGESYVISPDGIQDFSMIAPMIMGGMSELLTYDNFTLGGYSALTEGQIGEDVFFAIDKNGVLSITGSGATYGYSEEILAPWYMVREFITEVNVDKGIVLADGVLIGLEGIPVNQEPIDPPAQEPVDPPAQTPEATPVVPAPPTGDATPVVGMVCMLLGSLGVMLVVRKKSKALE